MQRACDRPQAGAMNRPRSPRFAAVALCALVTVGCRSREAELDALSAEPTEILLNYARGPWSGVEIDVTISGASGAPARVVATSNCSFNFKGDLDAAAHGRLWEVISRNRGLELTSIKEQIYDADSARMRLVRGARSNEFSVYPVGGPALPIIEEIFAAAQFDANALPKDCGHNY